MKRFAFVLSLLLTGFACCLPLRALALESTPSPLPIATAVPVAPPVPALPQTLPTPVPIRVSTPALVLSYGSNAIVQVYGIYGSFVASSQNVAIADTAVSQDSRQVIVMGKGLGSTTITLTDARGVHANIAVSVEQSAGRVAPMASVRITGAPASALFVAEQAANAATIAAMPEHGAAVTVASAALTTQLLDVDDITDVAVPVSIRGTGLYPVDGITHVRVENFAQPHVRPTALLVSDFPELLHQDGLLYSATLQPEEPIRLLFYHASPSGQPHRWIVLRATNHSAQDATISMISGSGGPSANEMFVGHLATQRFLVRETQNEGSLLTVPARSTVALVSRSLAPGTTVNDVLQLRVMSGPSLDLALTSQQTPNADSALSESAALLTDKVVHARGRYPIPEFFYEATYDTSAAQLEIPIGQLPLPNLRQGVALAGDYGVLFSVNATLINTSGTPAQVALYATPRGGRATGTYLIDRALVQTHALPSYSHYKLKQYTVPAHGFVNVSVVTMPEGGSSYPLNLIFAPDDGSVGPGAPGSPVY